MTKSFSTPLLSLTLLLHLFLANCCKKSPAPALYVFGDSLVDSGNNNFLQTSAKVDYNPYGIDFSGGATGRFTNGNTIVDFIAQSLGLPFISLYLGLSEAQKKETVVGVNYASGSAGILRETGTASGTNLCMKLQVKLFKKTVEHYLPGNFKTQVELLQYLSKSIFVVSMGSNDYINNYLLPKVYNSSSVYNPEQFAVFLLHRFKQHLKDLHKLGARKFVIFEIGPIGCIPAIVNTVKPTSSCAEDQNHLVSLFNNGLPAMLQKLSSTLQGSTFVHGKIYGLSYDMNINPSKYGFIDRGPCCVVGGNGTTLCIKDEAPCQDRTRHYYWDAYHPMQPVNYLVANGCFCGSSPCTPINIQQLVQKPM